MDAFWNRALSVGAISSFEQIEDDYVAPVKGSMMMNVEPVEANGKGMGGKIAESMGKGKRSRVDG